jgi:hypothetical protein
MNFDEENEPTTLEHEMRQIACRLAEVYGLDSVVILGCKQETTDGAYATMASHANAGNLYAGKHLARRYANS